MSLRLLLDQMLDAQVADALRGQGYDVVRVSEIGMARADDAQIMELAIRDNRVLVTLDQHFGDWAVLPIARHPGVLRIKADPATTQTVLAVLLPFLELHAGRDFADRLVIVRSTGIRWIDTSQP